LVSLTKMPWPRTTDNSIHKIYLKEKSVII